MQRRTVIQGLAASAATLAVQPSFASNLWRSTKSVDWSPLRTRLGDRLIKIDSPLTRIKQANGAGADAFFAKLQNPYLIGDEPGLTQTLGWADAWTSHPSEYGVAAESAEDVAAAIDLARTQRVRVVVRGGGHSYFGNSNAADSLLIWTRKMALVEGGREVPQRPLALPRLVDRPVARVAVGHLDEERGVGAVRHATDDLDVAVAQRFASFGGGPTMARGVGHRVRTQLLRGQWWPSGSMG
jgi:hypothetical protein